MQLNVLNDLAKAKRRWTEKKMMEAAIQMETVVENLLLRNTDVVENHNFEPPIREPPKHFRTPRHTMAAKCHVIWKQRPSRSRNALEITTRALKLRPANLLVCDRLRPSHLKLRPVHSQITTTKNNHEQRFAMDTVV